MLNKPSHILQNHQQSPTGRWLFMNTSVIFYATYEKSMIHATDNWGSCDVSIANALDTGVLHWAIDITFQLIEASSDIYASAN